MNARRGQIIYQLYLMPQMQRLYGLHLDNETPIDDDIRVEITDDNGSISNRQRHLFLSQQSL